MRAAEGVRWTGAWPTSPAQPAAELGAVLGAHVGPGTLAVCVSPRA